MKAGDRVLSYIVERELGEGGMGTVYLARHTVLNQRVAIKALSSLLSRDHAVRERFIQEANIQAALRHPGIVQVLNADVENEQPVLVMEYIEGKSLAEVLEFRGALPVNDALKIMEQVLSAVGYAHGQGVIHRDLKPENIMATAAGAVKVTDFGIAKVIGSTRLTRTGTVMGSAHYMSPEQILNPETVDARSDIYSLGCVFYELLTGHPPFGGKHATETDNDFKVKSAHVNEAVPLLTSSIPEWLAQVVMKMLEKAADKRPASCTDIFSLIRQGGDLLTNSQEDQILATEGMPTGADEVKSRTSLKAQKKVSNTLRTTLILFTGGIVLIVAAWTGYAPTEKSDLTQFKSGADVYKSACAACHELGVVGSPRIGDHAAWSTRIAQGYDTLLSHSINGFKGMPARGGLLELSDVEVARAVVYMANASGANFDEQISEKK